MNILLNFHLPQVTRRLLQSRTGRLLQTNVARPQQLTIGFLKERFLLLARERFTVLLSLGSDSWVRPLLLLADL